MFIEEEEEEEDEVDDEDISRLTAEVSVWLTARSHATTVKSEIASLQMRLVYRTSGSSSRAGPSRSWQAASLVESSRRPWATTLHI